MRTQRIIKRYPNRRLYDLGVSRYVKLADIHKLVLERIDFVVIDDETKADITSSALLQVILEAQQGGRRLLSRDLLIRAIRSRRGRLRRR